MRTTWLRWSLILLLTACGGSETSTGPDTQGETKLAPAALAYLNSALDIMQSYSINRYEIEWSSFRKAAVDHAGTAQSPAGTYDAIRFALQQLGDHHSFFVPPGGSAQQVPSLPTPPEAAGSQLLGDDVGYISVTAFSGTSGEATALATSYQRMIEGLDTLGVCGWVVDLRGNTGGNMWPMVAGIGPLAGEGVLGYFVDPDSVVSTWTYAAGASALNGNVATQVTDPWTLRDAHPPVAVLTDGYTASSGEATTIAFRGRSDTRSFGSPTYGVSTANRGFQLSDGAMIYLTVSTMADRTGRLYGSEIIPDEDVPGIKTGDPATDAPLKSAMDWLSQQAACSGG